MKNNKIIKSALLFALTIIIFSACDQIKPPYEQTNNEPIDTTITKKVLIEEYTGYQCGNCPAAAEESHRIKEKYGDKVVVLAIHVGQLAMPVPPHKYDFRSKIGNTLDEYYKIGTVLGTPNGLIDRVQYNSNLVLDYHTWEAAVLNRMKERAKMSIDFVKADYDTLDNSISTKFKIKFIDKGLPEYNIAVYIIEDSIVNFQKDYRLNPPDILEYVHNNTLRGALTDSWGEQISGTEITAGAEIEKDFSYIVPANIDWRMNWVRLVAVITNSVTKEVLQVNEKYLNIK